MSEFKYKQKHIPSGKVYHSSAEFIDRAHFLYVLSAWNKQSPNSWVYYE